MPADSERQSRKSGGPSGETPRAKRTTSGHELSTDLVSFTIDLKSGRIVRLEAVDPKGDRHELSTEEMSGLATQRGSTLEEVLERTFEAGISSVLEHEPLEEAEAETEDELRLRRLILRPMIERSAAGRLLKREVLGRAILGTLIQDAVASQNAASKPTAKASPPPPRSAAGGSRRQPPRGRTH